MMPRINIYVRATALALATIFGAVLLAACSSPSASPQTQGSSGATSISESAQEELSSSADAADAIQPTCIEEPLYWNIDEAQLVGRQGTTGVWGTCGQCCIANTLNLVTRSSYTEADIVSYTQENGLCVPETGGMTLDDMVYTYSGLLPLDHMDVYGYGGDYAPTIDEMASYLERGVILNVSVYGEMMREGGHTGEGEISGTHWIVLHSVDRAADGSVAGFGIVDSASDATYLTAQELSDVYYGHDGTTITDPACVKVYGWAFSE